MSHDLDMVSCSRIGKSHNVMSTRSIKDLEQLDISGSDRGIKSGSSAVEFWHQDCELGSSSEHDRVKLQFSASPESPPQKVS